LFPSSSRFWERGTALINDVNVWVQFMKFLIYFMPVVCSLLFLIFSTLFLNTLNLWSFHYKNHTKYTNII
jgi:hypothetical protein